MGLLNNKTQLKQQLTENFSESKDRLRLFPEEGVASKAIGRHTHYGLNTDIPFWEAMGVYLEGLGQKIDQFFHVKNLINNKLFVDVEVRTPQGLFVYYNMELRYDEVNSSLHADLTQWLNENGKLNVTIVYHGGKPAYCSVASFDKLFRPTDKTLALATKHNPNDGPQGATKGTGSGITDGSSTKALTGGPKEYTLHWQAIINDAAQTFGVDANLIAAFIIKESYPKGERAHNKTSNDKGLMQINDNPQPGSGISVYRDYFNKIGKQYRLIDDPFNARTSIFIGAKVIKDLRDVYGKTGLKLYAAYNGGPGIEGRSAAAQRQASRYAGRLKEIYVGLLKSSERNSKPAIEQKSETSRKDGTNASSHAGLGSGAGVT